MQKKTWLLEGRWEGKILGCEKNGPNSKCAFEQNNFVRIRYVARK
jgi:hypothetical protein